MNAITTRTGKFASRPEAWKAALAFVERFCGESGIEREICLKTHLVVEELFTNTVRHGHGGGSDAPVWITLEGRGPKVRLVYEDSGPPFNPFARRPTREQARAIAEAQREGGLGVILAHALAASSDYAYLFGRNRISFEVA